MPNKGLKDYIRYHMANVANKYYESHEDWEQLTAKGFVRFRVNIAPTLPPDAAPNPNSAPRRGTFSSSH